MAKNPVYMIGDVDVHNLEDYKIYREKVKPIIEDYGVNT